MNGFLVFFGIIGIVVALFAIVVIAIYAGSFIVVAIKSFKANVKALTDVQKEHIEALAAARKARLAKRRQVILDRKERKLEKDIELKKQKVALAERKEDLKAKKEKLKLDKVESKLVKDESRVEAKLEEKDEKQITGIAAKMIIVDDIPFDHEEATNAAEETSTEKEPVANSIELHESVLPDGSVEAETVKTNTVAESIPEENKKEEENKVEE